MRYVSIAVGSTDSVKARHCRHPPWIYVPETVTSLYVSTTESFNISRKESSAFKVYWSQSASSDKVGAEVGVSEIVGADVGTTVAPMLGRRVGDLIFAEGESVLLIGVFDGHAVVAAKLGTEVSISVGNKLGAQDGLDDGFRVGYIDGYNVGATVSPIIDGIEDGRNEGVRLGTMVG